ncbi:hypothetical protein BDP67DRAFT_570341 [Colletotrichum lupini]|nr:hypothetical protein BDP67DRAFT_570341 [Colletotrichum lupini]
MNTLFPWLSTYFESLIPGSFALGFNAGRETNGPHAAETRRRCMPFGHGSIGHRRSNDWNERVLQPPEPFILPSLSFHDALHTYPDLWPVFRFSMAQRGNSVHHQATRTFSPCASRSKQLKQPKHQAGLTSSCRFDDTSFIISIALRAAYLALDWLRCGNPYLPHMQVHALESGRLAVLVPPTDQYNSSASTKDEKLRYLLFPAFFEWPEVQNSPAMGYGGRCTYQTRLTTRHRVGYGEP